MNHAPYFRWALTLGPWGAGSATGCARLEGLAAGCSLNEKNSRHSVSRWLLEHRLSNYVASTFDAGPLPSETRTLSGPPTECGSHSVLLA